MRMRVLNWARKFYIRKNDNKVDSIEIGAKLLLIWFHEVI